jgi:dihydroxy-acid dehydratase
VVRNGDTITIDITKRKLHLDVSEDELKVRLSGWQRPPQKITKGYLALYAKLASSASEGAVLKL